VGRCFLIYPGLGRLWGTLHGNTAKKQIRHVRLTLVSPGPFQKVSSQHIISCVIEDGVMNLKWIFTSR
jgi:hypothetical protein